MSFDPHSTLSLSLSTLPSSTSPALSGSCSTSFQSRTCADPHGLRGDGFTESETSHSYEPKMVGDKTVVDIFNPIVTEQGGAHSTEDHKHYSTEEGQIPEIEDKFSLPHNQSLLSSTQDSTESLATPQEADLDDEQSRALLASPRYLPEREASAERSQIYHSEREGLISSSFQSLNFFGTGKPVACLSHQNRLGQDEFSEREQPADGQGMASPRHASNRRRQTREGPEPACVCKHLSSRSGTCRGEGRINVLPWYRPVGVAKTSSESLRR